MLLTHTSPGRAWLQFQEGWYVIDTRDGPLTDYQIALALYHIANRNGSFAPFDERVTLDPDTARLFLRTVWFDDTHGGIALHYDLLIGLPERMGGIAADEAEVLREDVERRLAAAWEEVPWHGQVVSVVVERKQTFFSSDHYSDYSQDWWKE